MGPRYTRISTGLAKHHQVTMVAPKVEQSAKSSSLTVQVPIRAKEMSEEGDNPRMPLCRGHASRLREVFFILFIKK